MKPKIIIYTTSYVPFVGGAEIAIQEVARRLSSAFDIVIVTARQKKELPKKETLPEGIILRVGLGTRLDKWLLPILGTFALVRYRECQSDSRLIWGMDISQGSLAAALIKWLRPRIPFVLTIQYGYGDTRLVSGRWGSIGFAFRRMLLSADYVTAISGYLLDTARRRGLVVPSEIIPNGVDGAQFFPQQQGASAPEKNHYTVVTTSRLVEKNAVDVLIRAVAEVKKQYPSVRCHIIGDGPQKDMLLKLTRELHLENEIFFLGAVPYEEIPGYLRASDLFVRASRSEGMGNSFIEALACGIPIIGTAVGGIPDIIKDGETGVFASVDDAGDLAKKIIMFMKDGKLGSRLARNGRAMVLERFSWDSIAKSYEAVFTEALNLHGRLLLATPLFPPEIGGPATYAHILLGHLFPAGIGVRVLRFSEVRRLPKVIRHAAYFLKTLWRGRRCDYLLALDPVSVGVPVLLASRLLRKPFAVKIVGDYAWEQGMQRFGVTELLDDFLKKSYGRRVEMLRNVERFVARKAKHIIVPSEYLKRVVASWGIDPKKIEVIPNAVEAEEISDSREHIRSELGLSGTVLVSAGRLVPWKGFAELIELMPYLIKQHPDLTLLIAGSGPQKEELESLIVKAGMQEHIKLLGAIPHHTLLRYFKAADAFILATGYEGFSHTLLEAMAQGMLVVTSRIGGNPEIIEHGSNGFLFDLGDRDSVVSTILAALSLSEERKDAIAEAALVTAARYTRERMVKSTANFFLTI